MNSLTLQYRIRDQKSICEYELPSDWEYRFFPWMGNETKRCDIIRNETNRIETIRYATLRYVTLRCDAIRYETKRNESKRNEMIRYVTLSCDSIRNETMRYETIRYVTTRYETIRCDMIRYEMIEVYYEIHLSTSVAKAMKVLRKLGCCLQIEVGIV